MGRLPCKNATHLDPVNRLEEPFLSRIEILLEEPVALPWAVRELRLKGENAVDPGAVASLVVGIPRSRWLLRGAPDWDRPESTE